MSGVIGVYPYRGHRGLRPPILVKSKLTVATTISCKKLFPTQDIKFNAS